MSDRFFLDTNIFVYSVNRTDPTKQRIATQLIREAVATRKGAVSYQVIQEFLNVALKRFTQPMTPAEAELYLVTVFRPLLAVHSSEELYAEALRLQARYRLSWYDSLVVQSARTAHCSILYSEDLQHGQKFDDVRVVNPFAAS